MRAERSAGVWLMLLERRFNRCEHAFMPQALPRRRRLAAQLRLTEARERRYVVGSPAAGQSADGTLVRRSSREHFRGAPMRQYMQDCVGMQPRRDASSSVPAMCNALRAVSGSLVRRSRLSNSLDVGRPPVAGLWLRTLLALARPAHFHRLRGRNCTASDFAAEASQSEASSAEAVGVPTVRVQGAFVP
jgi:hypothetical protein